MRLLLDTHLLLWAITDDPRLPPQARGMLLDPRNDLYFSVASIWEIAIKRTVRRESLPVSAEEAVRFFKEAGYEELAVTADHAAMVESLAPLHMDPFDRLLVAQAMVEPMHLVTHDHQIARYGASVKVV